MKLKFMDIMLILFGLIFILFVFFLAFIMEKPVNFDVFIFAAELFIPLILVLIIFRIIIIFVKRKWLRISINTLTALLITLYSSGVFFISFIFLFNNADPIEPPVEKYEEIKKKEYPQGLRHFPEKLPDNISNYHFFIPNHSFRSDETYLEFSTDEEYINEIIRKNKDNIYEKVKYKDLLKQKKYTNLDSIGDIIPDDESVFYIFYPSYTGDNYTDGFVVSKNKDRILFYESLNNKIVGE